MTTHTQDAAPNMEVALDPTEAELLAQGFDSIDAGTIPTGDNTTTTEKKDEEVEPTPGKTPTPEEETVTQKETGADPENKPVEETKPNTEQSLTPPGRYDGESDTQYQLRTELWRAGRARAAAETEEEKSLITDHIKELRKTMGQETAKSRQAKVEATQNQADVGSTETEDNTSDDEEQAAKMALEKLGYLDKNQVQEIVKSALNQQREEEAQKEHFQAITEFYKGRPDINADPSRKESLERYILDNFKITPQTSKRQLAAHLDMAASYLFPKAQRTAGASEAAVKRAVVSGSQNTKVITTDDSLQADLKKLGFSDEDIRASGW
jgi:hypothetical protein